MVCSPPESSEMVALFAGGRARFQCRFEQVGLVHQH